MNALTLAATAAATKPMSVAEFWDFCQLAENQGQSYELIRGEVIPMCRPTTRHGFVCSIIATELNLYARTQRAGFATSNDSGVVLDLNNPTVVGPDVAFYRSAQTYADLPEQWILEVPILAVEVLSPNDRWSRVQLKIEDYLANGVSTVWLVDPEERSVSIYRPNRRMVAVRAGEILTGDPDLAGFRVAVADFFRIPGEVQASTPT